MTTEYRDIATQDRLPGGHTSSKERTNLAVPPDGMTPEQRQAALRRQGAAFQREQWAHNRRSGICSMHRLGIRRNRRVWRRRLAEWTATWQPNWRPSMLDRPLDALAA